MKIRFLGTGTSQGVPVIGCQCEVCKSIDPRDRRFRNAALISSGSNFIAIDCGPDFRMQMLEAGVSHLDAVVITHEHNDHVIGLDDLRPFNFIQRKNMPIMALDRVNKELKNRFAYAFAEYKYPGAPGFEMINIVENQKLQVGQIEFESIPVQHGKLGILGFLFDDICYLTDVSALTDETIEKIKGINCLAINALRREKHHSHLNLEQCLNLISRIQPKQAYLTHISHTMGLYSDLEAELPDNVFLAYDGLEVEV